MRFRRSDRRVVVGLADTHAGHGLGLLNPNTVLETEDDDGNGIEYSPEPTKTQEKMWAAYSEHIIKTMDFADGAPVVVLHNGDVTHGTKFPNGLMNITPTDQAIIAKFNLAPWLRYKNVTAMRLLSGTTAHVLVGDSRTEAKVALGLASEFPRADIRSAHHERLDFDGVLFDVAHHGPGIGGRDWLVGNIARYYLRSTVYQDRRLGKEPARVYFRAHFHAWVWETVREIYESRHGQADLIVVPSYCGMTPFGRQSTRSNPALAYGMVAWEIIKNELTRTEPFIITEDLRVCEKL